MKSDYECRSPDVMLGTFENVQQCKDACSNTPNCHFFIFGKRYKHGRCWQELTNSSSCPEGWEADDYDFFKVHTACELNGHGCVPGCTNPRAPNYQETANTDDGSCEEVSACANGAATCPSCFTDKYSGTCSEDTPYRSKKYDEVVASKVGADTITVDGDLRDWSFHAMDRCYRDVPFAKDNGEEVVFETTAGGKYFGPGDFSMRWMLAWNESKLFLAADVSDDTLRTNPGATSCWENGLQVAFEVGGPRRGDMAGVLQAERSADLDISRLELINIGLREHQTSCSTKLTEAVGCCVHYELSQQEHTSAHPDGWFGRAEVAIMRYPLSKRTTYEVAFDKENLLGDKPEHLSQWGKGLRFGFSMLVNDGDEAAEQQGWGGYYPHSIVMGWNGGQKEPQKTGVVRLGGADPATPMGASGGGGGGGFGVWFLGFLMGMVALVGGLYARRWYSAGGGASASVGSRSRTNPMAADGSTGYVSSSSFTPPVVPMGGA
jgi:hypothetical protein